MRVFATGGNGFIGSAVVRTLLTQGHAVRCLLRETSDTARIDGLDVERVYGDVRDADSVSQGAAGCDAIIHLACLSAWKEIDSPLLDEVVERGTGNVLAAARSHGLRVVYVSSVLAVNGSDRPEVFDESATFALPDRKLRYARCKLRGEALCLDAWRGGVPVVIVNPTEVYGPDDTALVTAGNLIDFATSRPVLVCHGGTSVAFVDDVALAVVRALERGRPGERYILGGENLTVRRLAELTLEILGLERRIVTVPTSLMRALATVALSLHLPLPFEPRVAPYATRYWFVDSAKATRELGVEFRSAREALEPTLRWLQESGRVA